MAEQLEDPLVEGRAKLDQFEKNRRDMVNIMGLASFSVQQLVKRTSLNNNTATTLLQNMTTFGQIKVVRNSLKKRQEYQIITDRKERVEALLLSAKQHKEWADLYSQIAENFKGLYAQEKAKLAPKPKKKSPAKKKALNPDGPKPKEATAEE